jgi:branched-chain amino acid transport system permease protein
MFSQILINSLISASIYSLIALGFVVIYRTVRFFHFAHGAVYTVGAYVAYSLFISAGVPFVIALLLSALFAGFLGIAIDRGIYLPMRRKKSSSLVMMLASFGVFIFIENLIAMIYGNQILTIRTGPIREGHHILGAVITPIQIMIICVAVVLMVLLWLFIQRTRLGKAMRAVADDPIAASVVGINPEKTIAWSFFIGSALAGIAGVLVSLETNLEPTMGFSALLKGIIAAIVGGIVSIPGAVLGALLLGFAENFGIWYIPAGWKDAIAFGILIVFLLFRPQGILGKDVSR